jgi:hypothetical protein
MRTDAGSIGGLENLPCAAESPGRAPLRMVVLETIRGTLWRKVGGDIHEKLRWVRSECVD